MGVPAICSDGCGAAELIEDHPKWGCVYPVGDISQLAAALHEVALNREKFTPDIRDVEKTIGPEAMTTQFLRTVFAS